MASAPRSAVLGVGRQPRGVPRRIALQQPRPAPRGTADSLSHLDYAYQVSQGRLPETHGFYVSYDGPPSRHLERTERRQFASAHPPLFYAFASVVEGGALEDGQWPTAVARIRALNTVLGVGTLLIIAWAAWRLGGRRRAQLMIVSCALAGLVYPFVRHSADVYSDLLVTFLSTAAIALAAVALREGPRRGHVALLAVVCAAGMATKATFVITLVAVLGAIGRGLRVGGHAIPGGDGGGAPAWPAASCCSPRSCRADGSISATTSRAGRGFGRPRRHRSWVAPRCRSPMC